MSKTTPIPPTSQSLPIALLRAREKVMGPVRDMLADVGVTEQQWRVLRVLNEAGPLEPTRIAQHACLLLPSLTRILQKLEEKGMILRQADPGDGRKQVISITAEGHDLIATNLDGALDLMARLRVRFGPVKFDTLLSLLHELDAIDMDYGDKTGATPKK